MVDCETDSPVHSFTLPFNHVTMLPEQVVQNCPPFSAETGIPQIVSVVNYEDSTEFLSENLADDKTSFTFDASEEQHISIKVGFKFFSPNGDPLNPPIYYFRMMLTSCAPFEDMAFVLGVKSEQRFPIGDIFAENVHPTRCAPDEFDIAGD